MHTNDDRRFLRRRQRLAAAWTPVGVTLLLALSACLGWLFVRVPYLVNPVYVARQLATGAIERSTLDLMALLLPVAVVALFVVTGIMIGYGFAVFAHERRYQRMLHSMRTETSDQPAQDA
jgi:hypothetical protein